MVNTRVLREVVCLELLTPNQTDNGKDNGYVGNNN